MSKRKTQLTAQEVKAALPKINPKGQVTEKPYKLTDSHGLYLLVMPNGTKHWRWKFRFRDDTGTLKERQASFGSYPEVSLAKARERMEDARKLVRQGIDPIKAKQPEVKPETQTFRLVAEQFIEANKAGWKNEKHQAQWTSTLKTYAYPEIGELAVGDITLAHIVKILKPIWTSKPETAVRVRGRIENVLDYAEVQGWRSGKNPALWKGNLKHALPSSGKLKKVKHFAALDWQEVSAFMAKLRNQPGDGAKALEFLILTAARSGEVRGARWNEIDLVNKLWTIPGDRMKAGEEHRVPLSDAAHAVLEAMLPRKRSDTGLVFPG